MSPITFAATFQCCRNRYRRSGPKNLDRIWTGSGPDLDRIWTGVVAETTTKFATLLPFVAQISHQGPKSQQVLLHRYPNHGSCTLWPKPQQVLLDFGTMALQLTEEVRRRIRIVSLVVLLLLLHNNIPGPRPYLLRSAIIHPLQSPWQKLLQCGDDSSFLHMTGFTRAAFNQLLKNLFDMERHRRRRHYWRRATGRPPLLSPEGQLGLLLCYLGSTM